MRLSLKKIREPLVVVLIAFLISFFFHLKLNPAANLVGADSGLFLYIGERVLHGDVLYLDVWDHKPPGIFLVNALALALGGQTPWAIWWFEIVWVSLSCLVLFQITCRIANRRVAWIISILFLGTIHYTNFFAVNSVELFSLLPNLLSVFFLMRFLENRSSQWAILFGMMVVVAFGFKQTSIALSLSMAVTLLLLTRPLRTSARLLGLIFLGGFIPILVSIVYWGSHHALGNLWDGSIGFDLLYSQGGISAISFYSELRTIFMEQPLLTLSALTIGSLSIVLFDIVPMLKSMMKPGSRISEILQQRFPVDPLKITQLSLLIAFPLNLAVVNLSGRSYAHYYIVLLPMLCLGSAVFLQYFNQALFKQATSPMLVRTFSIILITLVLGWGVELLTRNLPSRDELAPLRTREGWSEVARFPVIDFVFEHTEESDGLLMWGTHAGINFVTGRRSPVIYPSATALMLPTSDLDARYQSYIESLSNDPPEIILALYPSSANIPYFLEDESTVCSNCDPAVRENFLILREYVLAHYEWVGSFGEWQYFIRID